MAGLTISMTSYGNRLKSLHERLGWVRQVPFLFNLYVGKDEPLSPGLVEFFERVHNARLHLVEDIGPLKKSYYAIQDFPDDTVFLVDDDWDYTGQWVRFAIDSYLSHSGMFTDCVKGLVARKIIQNPAGQFEIMEFMDCQNDFQKSLKYPTGHAVPLHPSFRNIVLSGGPGSFLNIRQVHPDFFDVGKYKSICWTHDEMWNWVHSVRAGHRHVSLHSALIAPGIIQELQTDALCKVNKIEHVREIFSKFIEEYPEIERLLVLG